MCDRIHYRSHSEASGSITSLGVHRFEHQVLIIDLQGNEKIGVGNGVPRDVYTSFWKEVANSLLIGETERVPYMRHDLFKYGWETIGKLTLRLDVFQLF